MINAGFIGFGRMGITHLSILNTHPNVRISGICDKSSTMLKILKKYMDVDTFSDYRKLIDFNGTDFVVISTPSESHSEIINCAIENGKHVFTEKPFAMNIADGHQTLDLLKGKNLVNQVGYVNRFNEVFCEVKKIISDGIIGEVQNFSSEMYGPTVLKDSKSTWRGKKHAGGGCMYEFASHCIDLAVYLIGKPDKVCGSILQNVYSSGVDDLVMTNLLYRNGITGNIIVNWSDETYRKPTNIIKVFGKEGKIIADKHMYKLFLKKDQKENGFRKGWNTRYITDFAKSVRVYVRGNEFTRQLDYFIECIEKGDFENISSFSEAHKTDIIMEQIRHDYLNSINYEETHSKNDNTISKEERKLSFWNRIFRNKFRSGNRSLN